MAEAITGEFDTGEPIVGRTNWRKFGVVMVPALAAAAATENAVAQGAMAASFQVSGQSFTVSFDRFTGEGFQQYAGVDTGTDGRKYPVAPTGIHRMTAERMCQSVAVPVPLVGTVVLRLTAGEGDRPVSARNLVVDTETLQGEAEFANITIGEDAGRLDEVPGHNGPDGSFGQRADSVEITHLKQRARSATAGTFLLPGLRMQVGKDIRECA
jgi:hypothetical protein